MGSMAPSVLGLIENSAKMNCEIALKSIAYVLLHFGSTNCKKVHEPFVYYSRKLLLNRHKKFR